MPRWLRKTRAACSPASKSWTFPAPRAKVSTAGAPGWTATYERVSNPQRPRLRRPRRPGFCDRLRHRGEAGAVPRLEGNRRGAQRSRRHPGRSRGPGPVLDHRRRHALSRICELTPPFATDTHTPGSAAASTTIEPATALTVLPCFSENRTAHWHTDTRPTVRPRSSVSADRPRPRDYCIGASLASGCAPRLPSSETAACLETESEC